MNSANASSAAIPPELVSALVDGQLQAAELAQALALLQQDPALPDRWHDYHLIGDILRSPAVAANGVPAVTGESDFMRRLQVRLAEEATPSMSAALPAGSLPPHTSANVANVALGNAANDSFPWLRLAAVAGVVLAGSLAWQLWSGQGDAGPALAQSQPSVLVATPQGLMARDAELDAFLAAHRELAGASALQMPSGFLRNATFETAGTALPASGR